MPLKPRSRIALMLSAMMLAGLLSYIILNRIQPVDVSDMEIAGKKAGTESAANPDTSMAGQTLSPATFRDGQGQPVRLEDFKGEVLLVNLWATWCPPCVAELPALDTLQARLKHKGLHVLAVSMDRGKPEAEIEAFLVERHLEQLVLYLDTGREIAMKWPYKGLPASYLIGRDGKVIARFDGPRAWDEGEIFRMVEAALD